MMTSRLGSWLLVLIAVVTIGCQAAGSRESRAGEQTKASVTETSMQARHSASNYDVTPLPRDEVEKLAARLDPEAYRVTQKDGTEPAFCGTLLDNKKEGVYYCVVCGLPLFSSDYKFDSGTGWPSFWREFDPEHVSRETDKSHGMVRTEINCARCGAHLGHVFDDGPPPSGERHCLNSAALTFHERGEELPPESRPLEMEVAYFAGGCFWGIEHYFQQGPGVLEAVSGYMQGDEESPTYKQICHDKTGHAETVKVVYDPTKITYRRLLEAFFAMHDPTQLNRQGPDIGEQYRSGVWYASDEQRGEAETYIRELEAENRYRGRKVVTQVAAAKKFWPAEDYHQDYIQKTGRACHVADPW
jgi:peptide methionine sulfoxide reductase msrA/msrB